MSGSTSHSIFTTLRRAMSDPPPDSKHTLLLEGGAQGHWEQRLAALNPYRVALVVLCLGLAVSPFLYFTFDMDVWFIWAHASEGARPWYIYRRIPEANYPAFIPYLITLAERMRLILEAPEEGRRAVLLMKLPNLLAYLAGVPLCLLGLRRLVGVARARAVAVLYALCLPLFVNAALWGQWDALLSLAVVAAVLLLLNDRPIWAGAAAGWALAIKLQAIIVVPVLLVYVARRFGAKALAAGIAAGLLMIGLVSFPYLLTGTVESVKKSYVGAPDLYPQRTMAAYNGWYLLDGFDTKVRKMPTEWARSDARPLLGPITSKQIGLAFFTLYTLFLLIALWRRPTRYGLVLTTVMSLFAFFMLPTQIHERYLVPAVAVITLIAFSSPRARALCLWLCATTSLNQLIALVRGNLVMAERMTPLLDTGLLAAAGPVALANVVLFVWATGMFWREVLARPAGAPDLLSSPQAAPAAATPAGGLKNP